METTEERSEASKRAWVTRRERARQESLSPSNKSKSNGGDFMKYHVDDRNEERWGQGIRLEGPVDLDDRTEEILRLHSEIVDSFRMSLEKAIRIGELLTSIKQELGHGQWGSWVEENLPFSQRTAERYMAITAIKIDSLSNLNLFDAYKLLPHKLQHTSKPKPNTMLRLTEDGYEPEEEFEPEAETPGAIAEVVPEPEIVETEEAVKELELGIPGEAVQAVEPDEFIESEAPPVVEQTATVKKLCRIFKAANEEDQLSFLQWAEINYKDLYAEAMWVD